MEKNNALDAQAQDVVEVVSVESMAEVSVSEIAEAVPGYAVTAVTEPTKQSQDTIIVEISEDTEYKAHEDVPPHKNGGLKSVLECLLFVSTEPLTAKQLADNLELEVDRVEEGLTALEEELSGRSGLQLIKVAGAYQLCTKPEFSEYCSALLQPSKKKLSKAALETLAVVAYRQPCTMPEIEAVRGVSVDGVMKTLMERGLVKEAGRKQAPGRPILYATTQEFLEYFGLNSISELPDIDMLAVEEVKALESQRELFQREVSQGQEELGRTEDTAENNEE